MILGALLGAGAAIGIAAHGAFQRNSPVFGRVLSKLSERERRIALTFDDGPNADATPRILDTLAEAEVRATFFLLGRHVDRWPDLAKRVANDGHSVGNHGYYHRKLHRRGPGYTRIDLQLGTQTIEDAAGVRPRYFRAPHGFRNPWVHAIAAELGQRVVGWTLGVWDSDKPGDDVIVNRTLTGCRPGTILLLHDGDAYDAEGDRTQTARALPVIIRQLRDQGYDFVPLP